MTDFNHAPGMERRFKESDAAVRAATRLIRRRLAQHQATHKPPPEKAMKTTKTTLRTPVQARQWMDEQGLSQAALARRFGVTASLIDAILRGSKPCKRGASHNIAVYLGLKRGQAVAARQPCRGRAAQAAGVGGAA